MNSFCSARGRSMAFVLSHGEPGELQIRLEIRNWVVDGMSLERDTATELGDASTAKLALSHLPAMVMWVPLCAWRPKSLPEHGF